MRSVGITFISLALTTAVIGNAYYHKKQFYPSVVYITKSNPSMAVIYVQALILVVLMGKLMRKIFFGQLRAAEFEHLMERSWYAVTETCLAFTVFRDDFSPKFVALFTVLLFIKSFHWLAEERVDFMERSPVISWLFHTRVLSLLTLLGGLDLHFVGLAYLSTITKGASVQLVFGFEYAILLTIIINIFIKYVLHTLDLNSENPWDNKAVFLLYTELVMGFFKVILYIAFVAIMVRIYTLPLFAFRPMYYTMRSFKKAFNDVILSRRAIRNMNTLYPDATAEELAAADNVCIICREEMLTASKKLPCNHIFHTSCLRSWFQRQQTCPTCRLNILRVSPPAAPPVPPRAHRQPEAQPAPHLQERMNQFQPGFVPMWQAFQQPATEPRPTAEQPQPQPQMYPNFPLFSPPFPFLPFNVPPPVPPPDLATLSDEDLRRMEGSAREAVEARLRCLQDIKLLLDASVSLMHQYSSVAAAAQYHPPPATTAPEPTPSQAGPSSAEPVAGPSGPPPRPGATEPTVNVATPVATDTTPSATDGAASSGEPASATTSAATPAPETAGSKEQEEIRRRRLEKFSTAATPP